MNKRNLLIIIGLVLVIFFGVLVYFQYSAPKVVTEMAKTRDLSQDNQKVSESYVDNKNGFSFNYPKNFHVYHDDIITTDGDRFDRNAIRKNGCDDNSCSQVFFGVQENSKGLTVEKYIFDEMQWKINGKMEQKDFGNKVGKIFYPISDFDGTDSEATWIRLDERRFLVLTLGGNNIESLEAYREILSTLKFSK